MSPHPLQGVPVPWVPGVGILAWVYRGAVGREGSLGCRGS